MYIKRIELTGYSSYKDYTCIDMPGGIIGIVGVINGETAKSNGAGKTSLVMAINYALYGEGDFDKMDELKNRHSENMSVRLSFDLNGTCYVVDRGIDKNKSYLIFLAEGVRIGDSISSAQEEIIKLLGMDYSMFSASIFFEQNNMDKFINVPAETRRKYVDKVIGNERWTQLYKINSKELKDLESNISKQQSELTNIKNTIDINTVLLNKASDIEINITELSKKQQNINDQIAQLKNAASYQVQYATMQANKKLITDQIADSEKQLNELQALLELDKDFDSTFNDLTNQIDQLHLAEQASTSESLLNKQTITDIQNKLSSITTEIAVLTNTKQAITDSLLVLSAGTCVTCLQPINMDLIERENAKKTKELSALAESIDKLVLNKASYNAMLTEINTKQTKVSVDLTKYTNKLFELETLYTSTKSAQTTFIKSRDAAKVSIDKLNLKQSDLKKDLTKLEQDIVVLATKLVDSFDNTSKIETLQQDLLVVTNELNKCQQEIGKLTVISQQTTELTNRYAQLSLEFTDNKVTYDHLSVAVGAFHEIPRQVFSETIKDVEQYANNYIHEIYPHISVKFYEDTDKKNNPLVIACLVDNMYSSYKRLSGGQKTVVNIGLRLGFSKVLMSKAQTQLQFLVLDEPFGSLDEDNRSIIKKVLTSLSSQFNQIFIITHTEDASDFPNVIQVKMDTNYCSSAEVL